MKSRIDVKRRISARSGMSEWKGKKKKNGVWMTIQQSEKHGENEDAHSISMRVRVGGSEAVKSMSQNVAKGGWMVNKRI